MEKQTNKGPTDRVFAKGHVTLQVWNAAGELLETHDFDNLIVNQGKQSLARLLGAASDDDRVSQIYFGINGSPPDAGDSVATGGFLKDLDSVSYAGNSVIFGYTLELTEGNGLGLQEFCLFTVQESMFSRVTRTVIMKTSDIRLTGTWTITF